MRDPILPRLGAAIRRERDRRGMNQTQLAARVGRPTPRISELETDLLRDRSGHGRLALLAEVCDALDLALVAVPREMLERVETLLRATPSRRGHPNQASLFDELFVDLSDAGQARAAELDEEPR
ncbi:helix-turn-helix domain-containing protein [Caulobacter sp. RL271]|uniref:Helix-turn-helix domain-containing protein n=1 Tax=Caulobacter segnis TaxID=88688 RepID=A0ABY4ZNN7_9CAUL|nr:helix-turn-helix transcriptional regulator [Caulobacter segnis]USQ94417.1 helix-turn-helix domain-containing protein [Caulobacter segnis]